MSEHPIVSTSISSQKSPARLFFVDHLRAALVILVVLHHLAVIYAANTAFYYLEPTNDVPALVVLVLFQLANQAYFMGFFFLLSGYFVPGSFDRKGPALYLKDRLLRLGIPLLVFTFILGPISAIGIYQMPAALTKITMPLTWQQYPTLIGIGPLWFAVMLLIFDLGYVAWRMATRNRALRPATSPAPPSYPAIGGFILGLALASYLLRIVMPLGMYFLSFPTLAYLPQYLSFFILGIVAFRRDWLRTIPNSMGKMGLVMALVTTLTLLPLALSGKGAFLGKGYWQSGIYALWDSTFSVGMCLGLITLFRRFFNHTGNLGRFLSRHAFTVYIIHIPIIVLLALALRGIHPEQLLKFGLAAIIGVPLCFGVAFLVRKIPLASRVL